MPVLSTVAILAFVALLGAAIAILVAVRRSRRHHAKHAAVSNATYSTSNATPPPLPGPPHLRNFPTRLGKHPAAAGGQTGWNPFGSAETSYADLSDPTPGGRRLKPPSARRVKPNDIGD